MVLARVANVKSGWKSMFMVFTTAASDDSPQIVRLAFDTIEKIVREHFHYITETETTTFTDCVNCLIAFTNNPHSLDVSLNAIAFLRFCAMKLAEGDIGRASVHAFALDVCLLSSSVHCLFSYCTADFSVSIRFVVFSSKATSRSCLRAPHRSMMPTSTAFASVSMGIQLSDRRV